MTNPTYLKNDLWQKVNCQLQACQSLLAEFDQETQTKKDQLTAWLEFWQRELRIIELETDAHHTPEKEKRQAIFKEMQTLLKENQALRKYLKNYEPN